MFETAQRRQKWEEAAFINEEEIERLLSEAEKTTKDEVLAIIEKARQAKGLTLAEAAALLQVSDPDLLSAIFAAAKEVKERIYGKRVVLFAPLYVSDFCVNSCVYCGYQRKNKFRRRKLTQEELAQEVRLLENMGHKRLALEAENILKNDL